ncbi:hypothetical protein [Mycoplasma miroungirhinis]|uniref:DUF31 domain-containing protein n=1 Tax=Mycoplasma miroungirhinis TaxID=754516 RepID=A0A6M4JCZ7_9MOLU|nr:hypothetical protein [Mycoplasma miroungirhinis]QJR43906.1 hypothetical protein HLA92_00325 [Mycoplasma miroungirhinis]
MKVQNRKRKFIIILSTVTSILAVGGVIALATTLTTKKNDDNKEHDQNINLKKEKQNTNNNTSSESPKDDAKQKTNKNPETKKQVNAQISEYVKQIQNLKVNNDLTKKIIDNEINNPTDNTTQQTEFINEIKEFDNKLSFLKKLNSQYSLGSEIQNQIENLDFQKITHDNITQSKENIEKLFATSKTFIKNNKIASNDNAFNNLKNDLHTKINESGKITNKQKTELNNKLVDTLFQEDLNQTQFNFQQYENKYEQFQNNFSNSLIENSIKKDLQLSLNINKNKDNYRDKLEELLDTINTLKTKLDLVDNELNSPSTNNLKKYDLYVLKSQYRNIFDTKLEKLHILDFKETINKITEFNNKIDEINAHNYESTNKDLNLILLEKTKDIFKLEEYQGAKKYNFEEYETSGSFNLKSAKLFFDYQDTDVYDFEIINLELKGNNLETLEATIQVKIKGVDSLVATFKKQKTFAKTAKDDLETIKISDLDQIYDINYELINSYTKQEWQNLSQEEKNKVLTPKNSKIGKYFNQTFSNLNIDTNISANIDIKYINQIVKTIQNVHSKNNITWRADNLTKEEYWDKINLEKIYEFLYNQSDNRNWFFENLTIKNLDDFTTHSDILASQAKEYLNKIYNFPKLGKYEIIIDEIEVEDNYGEHLIKNGARFGGIVHIYFWYKKDGVKASYPQSGKYKGTPRFGIYLGFKTAKNIGYSLGYLNYEDIKPKAKHFTAEDFSGTGIKSVDEKYKQQIDRINESNFSFIFAEGKVNDRQHVEDYRSINVKSLIEQEAFNKLNYFIKIGNGVNRKGVNHDADIFLSRDYKNTIYDVNIDVNNDVIAPADRDNQTSLLENFFYYFYDVKQEGKRGMSFKVGWINRFDNSKRYTANKTYHLINIVNDYEQALYPEVMLNNLTLNDLNINTDLLQAHNATYFKTHLDEINQAIKVKANHKNNVVYKNFELPITNFKVSEIIADGSNAAYIKFSVDGYEPIENKNVVFNSHTWFRIEGFNTQDAVVNEKQLFDDSNLSVIINDENNIQRKRVIEPYWRDLMWNYDEKT